MTATRGCGPLPRGAVRRTMAIGQRVPMVDAVQRVTGRIPYVLNLELLGMLAGRILRSPHPHARIVRVDTRAAERLPGVVVIATGADLADERLDPYYGPLVRDQPVLAIDRARYAGEAVAAVAAVDERTALQAMDLIEVEYEKLPAVFDAVAALDASAPIVQTDTNVHDRFEIGQGDVEAGYAQADLVVEETYHCPAVQHVPLEPHVSLAQFEAGQLTIWSSTQTPYVVRDQLARIFKLPHTRVRVIVQTLGGGYGAKTYPKLEPIAALLAWKSGRPVRIALDRAEDFITTCRSAATIKLKTGVMRDGTIVAARVQCFFNKGAYAETGSRVTRTGGQASLAPYAIPNKLVDSYAVFTNIVPSGPFRGPGTAQAVWATESHFDEVARRIGVDPLELRRRNLVRDGDRYIAGGELEDLHYEALLDDAERVIAYRSGHPLSEGGSATTRRGQAIAVCLKTTRTPSTSAASCKLNEDGSLHVLTSSVEMGQGAKTVLCQMAADAAAVPLDRVSISDPDTDLTPYDDTTSASRTTHVMGTAIQMAGHDVRRQVAELAAEELEVSPEDLELADGVITVKGAPERSMTYGDLVRKLRLGTVLGQGRFISRAKIDSHTGQPGASAHWHHAVCAAEVEVDTETGHVTVTKLHGGVYAGVAINPRQCELQTEGSVLFGLGQSLMEEMVFDDGRLTNPNLSDYLIPSFGDMPLSLTTSVLETADSDEVHGLGETTLPPAVAAISAAVADAVGHSMTELPITPERVLRALRGGRK